MFLYTVLQFYSAKSQQKQSQDTLQSFYSLNLLPTVLNDYKIQYTEDLIYRDRWRDKWQGTPPSIIRKCCHWRLAHRSQTYSSHHKLVGEQAIIPLWTNVSCQKWFRELKEFRNWQSPSVWGILVTPVVCVLSMLIYLAQSISHHLTASTQLSTQWGQNWRGQG